jgi:DNA-binding Xre family transcriptional regulator
MSINQNMDIDTNTKHEVKVIDGVTHVFIINEIVVNNNDFEQRVKVATILSNMTLGDVAKQFGITQATFSIRCKTGKMNFIEQRKIAEILGCTSVIKFVFNDGSVLEGNTIKQLIMDACAHVNITQMELGKRLGKSKQNFNSKLNKGRFTNNEIRDIASKIGCTYYNYFEMEDGTQI